MANIKSAAKRARQSVPRTARNASTITALKTQYKKIHTLIQEKQKDHLQPAIAAIFSSLDKAAKKGAIHKNTANRKKASISKSFAALS